MFCYNCGAKIEDDALFCSACGANQKTSVGVNDNETIKNDNEKQETVTGNFIQKEYDFWGNYAFLKFREHFLVIITEHKLMCKKGMFNAKKAKELEIAVSDINDVNIGCFFYSPFNFIFAFVLSLLYCAGVANGILSPLFAILYVIAIALMFIFRSIRIEVKYNGGNYYIDSVNRNKGNELANDLINHPDFKGVKTNKTKITQKIMYGVFIVLWVVMLCQGFSNNKKEDVQQKYVIEDLTFGEWQAKGYPDTLKTSIAIKPEQAKERDVNNIMVLTGALEITPIIIVDKNDKNASDWDWIQTDNVDSEGYARFSVVLEYASEFENYPAFFFSDVEEYDISLFYDDTVEDSNESNISVDDNVEADAEANNDIDNEIASAEKYDAIDEEFDAEYNDVDELIDRGEPFYRIRINSPNGYAVAHYEPFMDSGALDYYDNGMILDVYAEMYDFAMIYSGAQEGWISLSEVDVIFN